MRTKKVTRHYCEFCSKGSFRKPFMIEHEKGCTKNPDRECYLCHEKRNFRALILAGRLSGVDRETALSRADFDAVRLSVDQCPACILSFLRMTKHYPEEQWSYSDSKAEWERAHMELDAQFS